MNRALALDIGGVVYRSWPDDHFYRRWSETTGCPADVLSAQLWTAPHWAAAERGEITPHECFCATAARLGISPELVRDMATDGFASNPDEAIARYVESVRRRGITVFALTNNVQPARELLARPELSRLFDFAVSSADVGFTKPDAAIYRRAEMRLGFGGDRVVFVDDVLTNVEGGLQLGWRGIQFRSTEQVIGDIEAALTEKSGFAET